MAARILPLVLIVLAALAAVAGATAQDGGRKLVFTVGVGNDVDTLNPLVGVEVPDYEVWNLHYATLTDKAASDFHTTPGLAESWQASNEGRTYTYRLREGLEWSDGRPLTAEDVAYTVNRGRREEWLNYTATVENLTAQALDDRTVRITSSVADPKLPTMDVYILPKHVWERYDADQITRYNGLNDVGSGPFVLDELKRGQFWRLKVNPSYWRGRPAVDEVVFRYFNNDDAMVAALRRGEIDAIHDVPTNSFKSLESADGIVAVQGQQGGFDELAVNGGDGLAKPHPALLDQRVREAIAHAIDKRTLVDRVLVGLGIPGSTISPSASPDWIPEIPQEEQFDFDLDQARQILDSAGYRDTSGDGIREMPDGGRPLRFVYAVRSESGTAANVAEFVTGWLRQIGIATTQQVMNDSRLTEVIGKGEYDLFHWGWTPFVDPDPMLSYFTCDQVSSDPENPTDYYNDANWCDRRYDALYRQQKVELNREQRIAIVHRMLRRFHDAAVYNVLYREPDLQAYRTDRFTGWIRQPAEIGPALFSNTSPTYAALRPVAASSDEDGSGGLSTGGIIGIVAAALVGLALVWLVVMRRRSAEERE